MAIKRNFARAQSPGVPLKPAHSGSKNIDGSGYFTGVTGAFPSVAGHFASSLC